MRWKSRKVKIQDRIHDAYCIYKEAVGWLRFKCVIITLTITKYITYLSTEWILQDVFKIVRDLIHD